MGLFLQIITQKISLFETMPCVGKIEFNEPDSDHVIMALDQQKSENGFCLSNLQHSSVRKGVVCF